MTPFASTLIATAQAVKAQAVDAPGLERQRLHALADTLLAEARVQGATVKLVLPAVFREF
jgi:hypothetical protein